MSQYHMNIVRVSSILQYSAIFLHLINTLIQLTLIDQKDQMICQITQSFRILIQRMSKPGEILLPLERVSPIVEYLRTLTTWSYPSSITMVEMICSTTYLYFSTLITLNRVTVCETREVFRTTVIMLR